MSTINLFAFSKRQNSTARPTSSTPSWTLSGSWRAPLNVLQPVVMVEVPTGLDLFSDGVNYAHLPETGRWYWIDTVVMVAEKMAEIRMHVDVLGSYRTTIGNSTQYVTRAAADSNGMLTDDLYPVSNANVDSDEDISMEIPWWMLHPGKISDGYYVVGIVNDDATAVGATSYYVMDQAGFSDLRHTLLDTTNYTNMTFADLEEPLYKSLFNPFQYITSCVWFPILPPSTAFSSFTWRIGWFDITPLAGHVWHLDGTVQYDLSGALQTVNHPQISEGGYFQHAPYTRRSLFLQPFGEIPLDCSMINDINHVLKLETWIDYVTGDVVLRVINTTEGNAICGSATGKLGVPIQMAQATQDVLGAAGGAVQALVGAAQIGGGLGRMAGSGGMMGSQELVSGVQQTVNGVISAAEAFTPSVGVKGTNGSLLSTIVTPIYHTQFYLSAAPSNAIFGKPLCDTRVLSTLTANGGFVKCQGARISVAGAYSTEMVAVEEYLNSGIFYE